MPDDKLKNLYDNIIGTGKVTPNEIGDYPTFTAMLGDPTKAGAFYSNLMKSGVATTAEVGDFDTFYRFVQSGLMFQQEQQKEPAYSFAKLDNIQSNVDQQINDYILASPTPDASGTYQFKSPLDLRNDETYQQLERKKNYVVHAKDLLASSQKFLQGQDEGGQFFKGLTSPLAKDFFTAGLTEMGRNFDIVGVARKAGEGKELTEEEQALLAAYGTYQSAMSKPGGLAYSVGQQLAMQIPYMVQFAATGGAGNVAQNGVNAMLKVTKASLPKIMKDQGYKAVLRQVGRELPGLAVKGSAQTSLMPMTYSIMGEKLIGEVSPEGEIISQPTLSEGIWKGLAQAYPEVLTESMGAHIVGTIGGAGRAIGKKIPAGLTRILTPVEKVRKAVAFGNFTEEFSEEMMNNVLTPMLDPDTKFSDVWTGQNILTTALTIAATGGAFYASNQAYKAIDENSLRSKYLSGLPKNLRTDVIGALKAENPKEVSQKLTDIVSKSGLAPQQAKGILDYAWAESMRKGMAESIFEQNKDIQKRQIEREMTNQIAPFVYKDGETLFQVLDNAGNVFWVKDGEININSEGQSWTLGKKPLIVVPMEGGEPRMMAATDVNSVRTSNVDERIQQQMAQFDQQAELEKTVAEAAEIAKTEIAEAATPDLKTGDNVTYNGREAVINSVSGTSIDAQFSDNGEPVVIPPEDYPNLRKIDKPTVQPSNVQTPVEKSDQKVLKASVGKNDVDIKFTPDAQDNTLYTSDNSFKQESDANKVIKSLSDRYSKLIFKAVDLNTDPFGDNNFVIQAKPKQVEPIKLQTNEQVKQENQQEAAQEIQQPEEIRQEEVLLTPPEVEQVNPSGQAEVVSETEPPVSETEVEPELQPPQPQTPYDKFTADLGLNESFDAIPGNAMTGKIGDADIVVAKEGNRINLESIRVPLKKREKGQANAAMKAITDKADELGLDITLRAVPEPSSDMTPQQLRDWYRKFGFSFIGNNGIRVVGSEKSSEKSIKKPVTESAEEKHVSETPQEGMENEKEMWEMTQDEYYQSNYAPKLANALESIRVEENPSLTGGKPTFVYYVNGRRSDFAYKTSKEAEAKAKDEVNNLFSRYNARNNHLFEVAKALTQGKTVPQKVLADYPDLIQQPEKPAEKSVESLKKTPPDEFVGEVVKKPAPKVKNLDKKKHTQPKRWQEVLKREPESFEESILQYLLSGGRFKTADFIRYAGFKEGSTEVKIAKLHFLRKDAQPMDTYGDSHNTFGMDDGGAMDMINKITDIILSHKSKWSMAERLEELQGVEGLKEEDLVDPELLAQAQAEIDNEPELPEDVRSMHERMPNVLAKLVDRYEFPISDVTSADELIIFVEDHSDEFTPTSFPYSPQDKIDILKFLNDEKRKESGRNKIEDSQKVSGDTKGKEEAERDGFAGEVISNPKQEKNEKEPTNSNRPHAVNRPADRGNYGSGRPPLVYATPQDIPTPKEIVKEGDYPLLDNNQVFAVNLILTRFDNGGKAFLLADGTGVGKTMQMLVAANEFSKTSGKPVLIITENKQIIDNNFSKDARNLGIDVKKFEFGTYQGLRTGEVGKGDYGLIVLDEAHNLKNMDSGKRQAADKVKADHKLYATATPMDTVMGSTYFISEVTNLSVDKVYDLLGFMVTETKDKDTGEIKRTVVLKEGVSPMQVRQNIIRLRDEMIANGSMLRREYPFFGTFSELDVPVSESLRTEEEIIERYWQDVEEKSENDAGFVPPMKLMHIRGQRSNEMSRWNEQNKIDAVAKSVIQDVKDGKKVVVIAEGINETFIKGLDKNVPGFINNLVAKLAKEGITVAKIYGNNNKTDENTRFQNGEVDVVIGTPLSAAVGIDLDDQIGGSPRKLYMVTPNYSGNLFQQIIGRISRRNTKSPSEAVMVYNNTSSDLRRKDIVKDKLNVLQAIQNGILEEEIDVDQPMPTNKADGMQIKFISDNAFIVTGDTYTQRLKFKNLSAIWNKKERGWQFPKWRESEIRTAFNIPSEVKKVESNARQREVDRIVADYDKRISDLKETLISDVQLRNRQNEAIKSANKKISLFGQEGSQGEQDMFAGEGAFGTNETNIRKAIADQVEGHNRKVNEMIDQLVKNEKVEIKLAEKQIEMPMEVEEKKAEPVKPAQKIEDFGEKIGGAKKDLRTEYTNRLKDITDKDLLTRPFSQIFPEPDYKSLVESGVITQDEAIWLKIIRDELGRRPTKSYRQSRWLADAKQVLDFTKRVVSGEGFAGTDRRVMEVFTERLPEHLRNIYVQSFDIYKMLNFPLGDYNSTGGYSVREFKYGVTNGKPWGVTKGNYIKGNYSTKEEAIIGLKAILDSERSKPGKTEFAVYRDRRDKTFLVGKQVGKNVMYLKTGFGTAKEARTYITEHQVELEQQLADLKEIPEERAATNRERIGEDYRNGKDVTPDIFQSTFGFRGVEFGNWVENDRRQQDLNEAYDALMDLSNVLGLPPKALSLSGKLGLAFGSRGIGGKRAPMAHYEPVKVVINLTKDKGPGTLAHEWFHALDNYFAATSADKGNYATRGQVDETTRKEVQDAFKAISKAIDKTDIPKRSGELDKRRSSPYWATTIEMAARSFEFYVRKRLADNTGENDYLVNFLDQEVYPIPDAYPYATEVEGEKIAEAFDNLFNILETKKEDGNTILFQLQPSDDIFYSNSIKALGEIKQDEATPERWKSMLLKNGAKEAELEWMGWDEFVHGKRSFTRNELSDWMNSQRVEVDEVELSSTVKRWVIKNRYGDYMTEEGTQGNIDNAAEFDTESEASELYDKYNENGELYDEGYDIVNEINVKESTTRYYDFQLPGGKNYRELLLTIPQQMISDTYSAHQIGNTNRWFVINDRTGNEIYAGISKSESDAKEIAEDLTEERINDPVPKPGATFTSKHFEQPNIVAHVRFNERTDADGNKVLFIEEIQSDWAQQGRSKGFKAGKLSDNIKIKEVYGKWQIIQDGNLKGEYATEQAAKDYTLKHYGGVPDMPFPKTDQWVGLAMKRMIRLAADNGFDKIAWTTGEQQVERYSLSKQLNSIEWERNKDGLRTWTVRGNIKGGGIYTKRNLDANGIAETFGKDISDKITNSTEDKGKLEGVDLQVGTTGMSVFYDRIIPNWVNKFGKKYGVKVEKSKFDIHFTPTDGSEVSDRSNQKFTAHSFDVTDELRNVAQHGLPLFQLQQNPLLSKDAEFIDDIVFGKNWTGFIEFHNTLTQMAKRVADQTGTNISVVKSAGELPNYLQSEVIRQNRNGNFVPALFFEKKDGTKEVWLISNQSRSTTEAGKTLLHEVVSHHGLRQLFGEKYNDILRQVWVQMPESEKRRLAGLYRSHDRLVMADEWLAKQAETLGDKTPSWIRRIFSQIRQLLRDTLGLNLQFTDNDLKAMFTASRENLAKEAASKPVTGKFAGEVIFDRETLRNQIIGEQGAQRLTEAGLAVDGINNLAIAKEMETAGKSEKEIWLATGWQKGKEGKWRMEIADLTLKENISSRLKMNAVIDLTDLINAPEIIKAYPALKNIVVFLDVRKEQASPHGAFIPQKGNLGADIIPSEIHVFASSMNEARFITAHEVQHAIQYEEGFATGGNVQNSAIRLHLDKTGFNSVDELNSAIKDLKAELKRLQNYWMAKVESPRYKGQKAETLKMLSDLQILERRIKQLDKAEYDKAEAFQLYQTIAGEVEARNAQNRMTFDDLKRAETMLSESEDVSREDQIVLMESVQSALDLTPEVNQTETEAFRRWFGKSVVVDENGKPLVVYHGTNKDFDSFEGRPAYYFTPKKDYEFLQGSKSVIPSYIKIENPYITNDWYIAESAVYDENIINAIKKAGHDGIISTSSTKPGFHVPQYIVFSPTQIKSATGNIGSFSPDNPDIRFELTRDIGDLSYLNEIASKIESSKYTPYDAYALRVIESEYNLPKIGDILPVSRRWDDGYPVEGEFIEGTSGVVIRDISKNVINSIKNVDDYFGDKVLLIGSNEYTYGHDQNEIVLENAKVLDIFDKPQIVTRFSLQTETEAFKKWFGNSVVTENGKPGGKPLILYHGTDANFNTFDINADANFIDGNNEGLFFFTTSREVAEGYKQRTDSGEVKAVYLKIENPITAPQYGQFMSVRNINSFAKDKLESGRYDGVISKNSMDYPMAQYGLAIKKFGMHDVYIVNNPTQIKSATGNIGSFSPDNPDIRFSLQEDMELPEGSNIHIPLQPPPPGIAVPYEPNELKPRDMFATGGTFKTKFNHAVENVFDNMLTIKFVEDEVERRGGKFNAHSRPYRDENMSKAKAQAEKEKFDNEIVMPYLKVLAEIQKTTGFTYREIWMYLVAKHAPERNKDLGKGKSGVAAGSVDGNLLTDQYANWIVEHFEEEINQYDGDLLQKLWDARNKMTRFTLNHYLNSGMISREEYDKLTDPKTGWKDYVPYRGWKDSINSLFDYQVGEIGDAYNPFKKADGRLSESDDPTIYMISMGHTAILAGAKNGYKQQMANLILLNPEIVDAKDLFWFKKVYRILDLDGNIVGEFPQDKLRGMYIERRDNGKITVIGTGVQGNHSKLKNAGGTWDFERRGYTFPESMEEDVRMQFTVQPGMVTTKVTDIHQSRKPIYLARQHEVDVFIRGERSIMVFADPKVAHAMNRNNSVAQKVVPYLQKNIGSATRYLAQVLTSKNPAFWPVNMTRDIGYAWAWHAINTEQSAPDFLRNIPIAIKATKRYLSSHTQHLKQNDYGTLNETDKMYERWRLSGGETSYFHLLDIDKLRTNVNRDMKVLMGELSVAGKMNENVIKKASEWLGIYSQLSENISRFATYMTAYQQYRKKGIEDEEAHKRAVADSKNVTVNFDKYGRVTPLLKAFYLFIGPNLGGVYNISKLANKNRAAFAKGTIAFMLLGMVSAEITRLLSPPDDDDPTKREYDTLNDFVKENYLVLPNPAWLFDQGKESFITIPMPQGFRALYAIGVIADDIIHGKKTIGQGFAKAGAALGDSFMPVSMNFTTMGEKGVTGERMSRPLIPDIAKPFYDILMLNEDFAGRMITRTPFTSKLDERLPEFTEARSYNNPYIVMASKWLNRLGGGDDLRSAAFELDQDGNISHRMFGRLFDINPARMEYLLEQYTGGVGMEFNNLIKTTTSAVQKMTGDEDAVVDTRNIPVLRRFYRTASNESAFTKWIELKKEVDDHFYYKNSYLKNEDFENYKILQSNRYMLELKQLVNSVEKKANNMEDVIDWKSQNEDDVKQYYDKMEEMYRKALQRAREIKKENRYENEL